MRQLFGKARITQAAQHVRQYPMADQSDPDQKSSTGKTRQRIVPVRSDACEVYYELAGDVEICLRPITRCDKELLRDGVSRLSDRSRYLRFFTGAKTIPEPILDRLIDVDVENHIAWGVLDITDSPARAIAAAHAIRVAQTETMEIALAVLDGYQSLGVARVLLLEIAKACEEIGVPSLTAETLSENRGARRLFKALGGTANYSSGPVIRFVFETGAFRKNAERLVAKLTDPKKAA
jgi:GNAT superfamily N-acetyltransferase